jgi:hypothetical protein
LKFVELVLLEVIVGVEWAKRDNEVNRYVSHIVLIGVDLDLGGFAGVWDGLVEFENFGDKLGTDIAAEYDFFVVLVDLGLLREGNFWMRVLVDVSGCSGSEWWVFWS